MLNRSLKVPDRFARAASSAFSQLACSSDATSRRTSSISDAVSPRAPTRAIPSARAIDAGDTTAFSSPGVPARNSSSPKSLIASAASAASAGFAAARATLDIASSDNAGSSGDPVENGDRPGSVGPAPPAEPPQPARMTSVSRRPTARARVRRMAPSLPDDEVRCSLLPVVDADASRLVPDRAQPVISARSVNSIVSSSEPTSQAATSASAESGARAWIRPRHRRRRDRRDRRHRCRSTRGRPRTACT